MVRLRGRNDLDQQNISACPQSPGHLRVPDICVLMRIGRSATTCYSITRLVKNCLVISVTEGSFSSEVTTVMNSFLQFQQCQRSWTSCALTRSFHSRLTNPEPHRGHFSRRGLENDTMLDLPFGLALDVLRGTSGREPRISVPSRHHFRSSRAA